MENPVSLTVDLMKRDFRSNQRGASGKLSPSLFGQLIPAYDGWRIYRLQWGHRLNIRVDTQRIRKIQSEVRKPQKL